MKTSNYLLIRSNQQENSYGPFMNEILKMEGFNGFENIDLSNDAIPELRSGDLVILTRCYLRKAEIVNLYNAVINGTCLVCIQPSSEMARQFGWVGKNTVTNPGWIKICQGYPGAGSILQTHIPITHFKPNSSASYQIPAETCTPDWNKTDNAAVIKQKVGSGYVVFFFYDLPKAVARIRFGNPELSSYVTGGHWSWLHASDLFANHIDDRMFKIPQADLHAQLLGKIITEIASYPLARFWYYKKAAHSTVSIFSSDGDCSKPSQFHELSEALTKNDASATFYLMKQTALNHDDVDFFRRQGHTFAAHINPTNTTDEWYFDFPRIIKEETDLFKEKFGDSSVSLQCHRAPWQGYMDWVPAFLENGYRMLLAYLSSIPCKINQYMCGSGRPVKFFSLNKRTYNCWQQPIFTYDDQSVIEIISQNPSILINEFKEIMTDNINKYHSAIGILSHPVSFSTYSRPFIEPCLELMKSHGVPVYNGDQWCQFQDRRHDTKITCNVLSENKIIYTINELEGELSVMLPSPKKGLAIIVDGNEVKGVSLKRLEEDYIFIDLSNQSKSKQIIIEIIPEN